jgi:hypothetical protein
MLKLDREKAIRYRRISSLLRALLACAIGLSAVFALPIYSQPGGPCLADPITAADGDLGYRSRGARCEGALQRFVSSQASITLVGYHRGTIDFGAIRRTPSVSLIVEGAGAKDVIALRALSITNQARYQMDSVKYKPGEPFIWSVDMLRRASSLGATKAADIETLSVLACTSRCVDRPETTYWPVSTATPASNSQTLSLRVRAGVRSDSVTVNLRQRGGGASTYGWPAKGVSLTPDGVATIILPADVHPGDYELTIEARDTQTREPLGALYATIVVPPPAR